MSVNAPTLLVVMNDLRQFAAIEPFLRTDGIKVTYAKNLVEAIAKIQTEKLDFIMLSWI